MKPVHNSPKKQRILPNVFIDNAVRQKKIIISFFASFIFILTLLGFKIPKNVQLEGLVFDKNHKAALYGVSVQSFPSRIMTKTDLNGKFQLNIPESDVELKIKLTGYVTKIVKIEKQINIKIDLSPIRIINSTPLISKDAMFTRDVLREKLISPMQKAAASRLNGVQTIFKATESYSPINENGFLSVKKSPLSTFSIDVDAASYSNVRRWINNGILPPKDAVRTEEMINYFDYDYVEPQGSAPINIQSELGLAPWNNKHKLLKIGIRAKSIPTENLPSSNIVFLIDVSGSMDAPNKLPLLVSSLKLLADQLRPKDKVAIVVYAGNAGLVLPSTSGSEKTKIKEALNLLKAGGSTAGGAGIELAYRIASENFITNGNNRIILATDGDFNVGSTTDQDMENLISQKRKTGIFLSVLGYGMGNYKDSKMEVLANKGNGNYAYIDNINEARKVLISQFGGTLFTVAKDVKLQIEFNPANVKGYRLIGYENRMLAAEDFNNDIKDAGEVGPGHNVTALYEIIPQGTESEFLGDIDELKYQKNEEKIIKNKSEDLLTIKLRYKDPESASSKKIEHCVADQVWKKNTNDFIFAAAVAEFGMLLRDSDFKQQSSYQHVIQQAESAIGLDKEGYRSEFVKLAKSASLMAKDLLSIAKEK